MQDIIDKVRSDLFTEQDAGLIRLSLSDNPGQEELDRLLRVWDIEVAGAQKALLLSYVMKSHPELDFPVYCGPRLAGLLTYYKFRNVRLMSHFHRICSAIQKEGIEIIPIKGGAMKALRPDLARVMSDIDILVPEDKYRRAVRIVEKLGYDSVRDAHSTDIHEKGKDDGVIDIHRRIPVTSGDGRKLNSAIFGRAGRADVFGVDVMLPCNEDLLFIMLMNFSRNIMDKTDYRRTAFTLFDIKYLISSKPDFDWRIVINNAEMTSSEAELSFVASLVNTVVPGLIPSGIESLPGGRARSDFDSLVLFRRYCLASLQAKSHRLGVSAVARNPKLLPSFLAVRPVYTFLKLFKYRPGIARITGRLVVKIKRQ